MAVCKVGQGCILKLTGQALFFLMGPTHPSEHAKHRQRLRPHGAVEVPGAQEMLRLQGPDQ